MSRTHKKPEELYKIPVIVQTRPSQNTALQDTQKYLVYRMLWRALVLADVSQEGKQA